MSKRLNPVGISKRAGAVPPPEVKCSKTRCRGATHDPSCPVFLWAMENWEVAEHLAAPKPDKRNKRGHHPKPGEPRLTPEQRAEINRTVGQRGGRPRCEVPMHLINILRKGKFRVREEFRKNDEVSEAAADLAGWALERLAHVAAGRIHTRKAPSISRSAAQIREEICEPIEKALIHKGGIDLGKALDSIPVPTGPRPSDEEPTGEDPPKDLQ